MEHNIFVHKETNGLYKVLNTEIINKTDSADGKFMVLYVSLDSGMTFVRDKEEFFDGRFKVYEGK